MPAAANMEYLRKSWLMAFLFYIFKKLQFHHQLQHCHQHLTRRQPTNIDMKNQSFIPNAHVIAEQFNSLKFKCDALIKLTTCAGLSNTDISEFAILFDYQCMFQQGAVVTCIHFGYSLCVYVLWAPLLEDTFDGKGL